MTTMEFTLQRIRNFLGIPVDPLSDEQMKNALRFKLNIHLPQKVSLDAALDAVAGEHEIIDLVIRYRSIKT